MEIACTQCGTTFRPKPYIARRPGNHFCTQTCYGLYQRAHPRPQKLRRLTIACTVCGVPVTRQRHAVENRARIFCGRACWAAWRRKRPLPTPRRRTPGRAADPGQAHDHYRGEDWSRQQRLARERDGFTCQGCGVQAARLPVHHKVPFRTFTDYREANVLENLVTLCPSCHGRADAAYNAAHPNPDRTQMRHPLPQFCRRCGATFLPWHSRQAACDGCRLVRCLWCGQEFENTRPTDRNARYCSVGCDHAHRQQRGAINTVRACVACGAAFTSKHWSVRYCSNRCHLTNANPRRAFFARRRLAAQESNPNATAP